MDNPKDPRAIAFTENRDEFLSALSQSCETVIEIDADSAQFPLAQNDVSHISCAGPRTPKGLIDRSVFVIADDELA
ncbi:MAG: hypothetical protein KJN99_12115 [Marinicaulis sp.]|nr:hypothetical protein [Marinicaulis sp.]